MRQQRRTEPPDALPSAMDAAVHTWPLYEMRRARASTSYAALAGLGSAGAGKHWCNVFAHRRELMRPGVSKIVTPNNDTLYSVAWLDLAQGPLVIDIPDMQGRYHVLGLLDALTNPFAHLGTRLWAGGPQSVVVHGPGMTSSVDAHGLPAGHVRAPTRWVWIIGRILVNGPSDLPTVHALQDGLRIRSLDGGNAPSSFDPGCDPAEPLGARHFCTQVNAALEECGGQHGIDAERLLRFAEVGIGPGLSPTPAQLDLLERALPSVQRMLDGPRAMRSAAHWEHLPLIGPSFGDDVLLRAHISRQYIGMVESKEAVYPMTWHDARGERLRGDRDYELYFGATALPPVDAFWSLTLYDSATCQLVENSIERYSIGDRTPGLVRDAQGGLRIQLGHRSPPDGLDTNWLPAPAGEFYLCLRAYLPRPELLDGRYSLPPVERIAPGAD